MALNGLKSIAELAGKGLDALAKSSPEFAGALDQVKGVFGELQGALMKPIADALTPVIKQVAAVLSDPAFKDFIYTVGMMLGEIFSQIGTALVNDLLPPLMELIKALLPIALDVFRMLVPIVQDLLGTVLPPLVSIIIKMAEVFAKVVEVVLPFAGALLEKLIPPILTLVDNLLPALTPLLDAVALVFGLIFDALAPVLGSLIESLMPVIIELINTLLPPFTEFLRLTAELFGGLMGALAPVLTQLIEKLAPVLADIAIAVKGALADALTWLNDFIDDDLGPIFEWLNDNVLKPVVSTFKSIIDVIGDVIGWFSDLWAKIKEGVGALPDWLVPGSPTPFEIGLRGIADALQSLPAAKLGGSLAGTAGALAPAAAGMGAGQIIVNVHGPYGASWTPYQAGQQAGEGVVSALRAKGYRTP